MQLVKHFIYCGLGVLIFVCSLSDAADGKFNYDQRGTDWGGQCNSPTSKSQSPIALNFMSAIPRSLPLIFENYNVQLNKPLVLKNSGYNVDLTLPPTNNGARPSISIGSINGDSGNGEPSKFEAIGFHLHWGSSSSKGSEHTVNGFSYDAELHIVHRNAIYSDEEAPENADGLAVLGIFLKIALPYENTNTGIAKISKKVPSLVKYESTATIDEPLKLSELLQGVNTNNFFQYNGSLTTPDCLQAVTWVVFPTPIPVSNSQLQPFWKLEDYRGQPLVNNYRPTQPLNGRSVFFALN